jgi:magnesium transporter
MMQINCFQIHNDGTLDSGDSEACLERWRAGKGCYWIDIQGSETEERIRWLGALDLRPSILRNCREIGNHTHVVPLRDQLFLEFSTFTQGPNPRRAALAFVCLKDLVITLHKEPLDDPSDIQIRLEEMELSTMTTAALVYAISLRQSLRTTRAAQAISARVAAIDARLDQDPDDVGIGEIVEQKRAVLDLDDISSEQAALFDVLSNTDGNVLEIAGLGSFFKLLVAQANYSDRVTDRLAQRAMELAQHYDAHRQNKLNNRLAVLTILSAVFLPLTLFVGIYGMNFDDMPELHYAYSYPVALGFMVLLAAGMLRFFYKRGWFS